MKETIKRSLGKYLLRMMPKRAEYVREKEFTMSVMRYNPLHSVLRAGIIDELLSAGKMDELSANHRRFWAGPEGTDFHTLVRATVTETYQAQFSHISETLHELLELNPHITTLVEIGCGGGTLLNLLASQFPQLDRLVGVDLSPATIMQNRMMFDDPRLEWAESDGQSWVEAHGETNTIYFSYRGVYEYFNQEELEAFFRTIAQDNQPAIMVSVEPIALDHDLLNDNASEMYGTEYSFSHNYPHLYLKNGFTIHSERRVVFDKHASCAVVASVGLRREPSAELFSSHLVPA